MLPARMALLAEMERYTKRCHGIIEDGIVGKANEAAETILILESKCVSQAASDIQEALNLCVMTISTRRKSQRKPINLP